MKTYRKNPTAKEQKVSLAAKAGRKNMVPQDNLLAIKDMILSLQMAGVTIERSRVISISKGVIKASNPTLLKECGGGLELTDRWARHLLAGMNMLRRKATTSKLPVAPALLKEVKRTFQKKIATVVNEFNIIKELIINFDQTPLAFQTPGSYTMSPKGSKKVPIHDLNAKAAITGTIAVNATGDVLPFQLIYTGKTERSLPKIVKFPDGFDLCFNEKHWANEVTSFSLIDKVILPFIDKVKAEKNLPKESTALLIFDVFRGQKTDSFINHLAEKNCIVVFVSSNMTDMFQPLDVTVNKNIKSVIRNCYNDWYSEQVVTALNNGIAPTDVKVKQVISIIKPLHAKWIIAAYEYHLFETGAELIRKGFESSHITEAIDKAEQFSKMDDNPFV